MRHKDNSILCVAAAFWLAAWVAVPVAAQQTDADIVRELTTIALQQNLVVRERAALSDAAQEGVDAARLRFLPQLSAQSRFSRAGGGRTIDLPLGDLLNPVYAALEAGAEQPGAFSQLDNQSIAFLRDQEQETRLRLTQAVYQPRLTAAVRARRAQADAAASGLAAYRSELARDVEAAYYGYRQAASAVGVLAAAQRLVDENLRTAERRLAAGDALPAEVASARAETFAVAGRRAGADRDRDVARAFLNTLLDRPLDAPVPEPEAEGANAAEREAARLSADEALALQEDAVRDRQELVQLDAAVRASESTLDLARADLRPSVSIAVDAGIQGRGYVPDDDGPYYLASVVAAWTLWGGGADRAELRQARAELAASRLRREQADQQIRLQVQQATDGVRARRAELAAARQRVAAAQEAFRLTQRLMDEGLADQLRFTDARSTLTQAELGVVVARYGLLASLADLRFAVGAPVAP